MFLIVEGLHDSGKSTLISKLISKLQFDLYLGKRMFPELLNVESSSVSDFSLGSNIAISFFANYCNHDVVFDRLHFSEFAYSVLKKRLTIENAFSRFQIIDSKLSQSNTIVVYLYCNYEDMIERRKDKNLVYTKQDYDELTKLFLYVNEKTKLPILLIDTSKDVNIVYEEVSKWILKMSSYNF